jgi:hypothetical protein
MDEILSELISSSQDHEIISPFFPSKLGIYVILIHASSKRRGPKVHPMDTTGASIDSLPLFSSLHQPSFKPTKNGMKPLFERE